MNASQELTAREFGLLNKFEVARKDGRDQPGGDREGAAYFVLDSTFDKHALPALAAYAKSCEADYPLLAADLRATVAVHAAANNAFVTVPETIVCGIVVPSFQVGQYLTSQGPLGTAVITSSGAPWVEIDYQTARNACKTVGLSLITELQYLAIAHNIAGQDINWTGGKVGSGAVFQGLHKGTVDAAQPGDFTSDDPAERRWHELSNGARIFDFAGNAYSWVFDNVQGDEQGLVAKPFAKDSPSIAAPYPSMESGMGWRPRAGTNWSGNALVRGGYWNDEGGAGVFDLGGGWPGVRRVSVGFRCTK